MAALDIEHLVPYVSLITLATASVYAGAQGTLSSAKPSGSAQKAAGKANEDKDDDEPVLERLTSADAWLFPVLGSFTLLGLFLVIKYVGKEWINFLLAWYFSLGGLVSVSRSLVRVARAAVGTARWKQFDRSQLKYVSGGAEIASVSWRTPSIFLVPLGFLPSILYTFFSGPKKSALLTNVLALSFAQDAMRLLQIDSFQTGTILLSGLFVYDIYWVFGTRVMVSVATDLDLPMKILAPKSLDFSMEKGAMMLGLGDIVVPGIFVALALRYDHYRHHSRAGAPAGPAFAKPYFGAALTAYVAGLGTTMVVMHIFRTGQPALLYLSPACILSFLLTAWRRGEVAEAWKWSDEPVPSKSGDENREALKVSEAGAPTPADASTQ
ncbi:hypothetical protein FA95DRAFT_366195 [Auriscalpium vulgare]|uniref:Uncharacterized protein n=1 Tax=Auriscalpium vulgare TaxID=40419 RepID=A0ACB8RIC7_9AGAM|nr:hypothetical protein FA95DRAFT_366195 [Auriscalpium vulgare]